MCFMNQEHVTILIPNTVPVLVDHSLTCLYYTVHTDGNHQDRPEELKLNCVHHLKNMNYYHLIMC